MGHKGRKDKPAANSNALPMVPVDSSSASEAPSIVVKDSSPGSMNAVPRPHWSTFIAPGASVLVAALSLFTTWYVFRKSAEANRNVVRPFVTFSYTQETPLSLSRSDAGMADRLVASGSATLANVGNTAAYGVTTEIADSRLTCSSPSKDTVVLPHSSRRYPLICDGKDPQYSSDTLGVRPIPGHISYRDVNGFTFGEPIVVWLCIGPLSSEFCKLQLQHVSN